MSGFQAWSLLAAYSSLTLSAIAFTALLWQLVLLSRSTRLDHDRRRRQATLEYLTATLDRRARYLETGIPEERDAEAISRMVQAALDGDGESHARISGYLHVYNMLAVGAEADIFDIEVVDQVMGGTIRAIATNYRPWMEYRREITGEARLFEDTMWLASQMQRRENQTPISYDPDTVMPRDLLRKRRTSH